MEKITLCGDDCYSCPRYNAHTRQEQERVAELWYRSGMRDSIPPPEEMACTGCSSHKSCTYGLVDCTRAHGVEKCSQCASFPCEKLRAMLEKSGKIQEICRAVCTPKEYAALEKPFFHKEENLKK